MTEQIVKYAARKIAQEEAAVRKAVNVNMARLEKSGQVVRVAKGVYCRKVPAGIQVEIRKPPVLVDGTNYRYLQLLDMIKEIDDAPVDTPKPVQVIRGAAEELALNTDLLILMARR